MNWKKWIGLPILLLVCGFGIYAIKFVFPNFITLYQELGATLPTPTLWITQYSHLFIAGIITLGGLIIFFSFQSDESRGPIPAILIVLLGILIGFLIVSIYFGLFNITHVVQP